MFVCEVTLCSNLNPSRHVETSTPIRRVSLQSWSRDFAVTYWGPVILQRKHRTVVINTTAKGIILACDPVSPGIQDPLANNSAQDYVKFVLSSLYGHWYSFFHKLSLIHNISTLGKSSGALNVATSFHFICLSSRGEHMTLVSLVLFSFITTKIIRKE